MKPLTRARRHVLWSTVISLPLLLIALLVWTLWNLPDVSVLKDRRTTLTLTVRDWQGEEHGFRLGPDNSRWTPLGRIPDAMKWAVIVAEDANFYEHEGIDVAALKEALQYDLEKKRPARGASTITQQVAKNVFLSREKTLRRKLREVILARRMEAELSKGRILELYLNSVELGPRVFGVGHGARYHFGKNISELTPDECAFLAAILPGPRLAYNPKRRPEKVRRRAEHILHLLALRQIVTPQEEAAGIARLRGEAEAPVPEETPTPPPETSAPPAEPSVAPTEPALIPSMPDPAKAETAQPL
jgi:monofunctional biosynthetic peptidoglycan transglycosylase